MMIEFRDWKPEETERTYLPGTKIAYVPLGEGAYGLILVTPWQVIFLEEVPQYGGYPRWMGLWHGTVEEAVKHIKENWR